jgi:miniconductance mechanosensitive channel
MLERLKKIPLIEGAVTEKLSALGDRDSPENQPDLVASIGTNFELYAKYVDQYLRSRKDLNVKQRFVLVRTLAPTKYGIPLDIFAFVRKTDLIGFSNVQTDIFNHLISLVEVFDLQLFQAREE